MPDREKVIKAWEIFLDRNPYEICSGREYRVIKEPKYCMGQMIEDTIALLKEQEAVKRTYRKGINGFGIIWTYGACGSDLHPNNAKAKFCSNCGQAVKWE